jgi:hypothetical protein
VAWAGDTSTANSQKATVSSVDATNITLAWTLTGTLIGGVTQLNMIVEVYG